MQTRSALDTKASLFTQHCSKRHRRNKLVGDGAGKEAHNKSSSGTSIVTPIPPSGAALPNEREFTICAAIATHTRSQT